MVLFARLCRHDPLCTRVRVVLHGDMCEPGVVSSRQAATRLLQKKLLIDLDCYAVALALALLDSFCAWSSYDYYYRPAYSTTVVGEPGPENKYSVHCQ